MEDTIKILLADDDEDDRFFFELALSELKRNVKLDSVVNGEKLMHYLNGAGDKLPDVLFLDINMPKKNGAECLKEIKAIDSLKDIPVIIHSTALSDLMTESLYDNGAIYYIHKKEPKKLKKCIDHILNLVANEGLSQPAKNDFILCVKE
ncbi:MAG: response regulator [Bacteroidota bacterium]|jgi:CheY-like chemotaxis protein|nr:response regulator [Bacteroidota bacterium]